MPRKQPEAAHGLPLVSSKRGKFTTLENVQIDANIHDLLGEYKRFVKDIDGEAPSDGAICSVALERLFAADQVFVQSKDTKRKAVRSNSSNAHASSAATSSAGNAGPAWEKAKKSGD